MNVLFCCLFFSSRAKVAQNVKRQKRLERRREADIQERGLRPYTRGQRIKTILSAQSFSRTLRVIDLCAEHRGLPHQKMHASMPSFCTMALNLQPKALSHSEPCPWLAHATSHRIVFSPRPIRPIENILTPTPAPPCRHPPGAYSPTPPHNSPSFLQNSIKSPGRPLPRTPPPFPLHQKKNLQAI